MSKPRYRWWGYVKNVIRSYPELKERLLETPETAVTARYSHQTRQSGTGRPVECSVVQRLSSRDAEEYEAVNAAIRETARMSNGEARLAIIDLVYWKRSHTLAGAGMQVGYSPDRSKEVHGEFVRLVGFYLDLLPREKVRKTRNVTPKSHNPVV